MSNIDERIVRMTFDNAAFGNGVNSTMSQLQALNKALKLDGASKGLSDVSDAFNKFDTSAPQGQIAALGSKFSALGVAAIAALSTIVTKAVDTGLAVAKALTFEPITAGFENYETQINAVQTILANTAAAGTKIGEVNAVLAELNTYANQTVYNFSEMTSNIGAFTAAGVGLKDSVASIKGIANLAALSGSNSQQAATAMYQLSQSIAAGKVNLQDWNSVVNAGLGGKTFQDALVNTARAAGVSIDSIIKKAGSFRNSLQDGWLTSKILVETLSQFTGDLNDQQLRSMGFSEKQAQEILKTGQIAVDAATKIKTLSQLTSALKEEVATAWAAIFKTIFGDIGEATDLFSNIHNVAENALTQPIYALNTLLQGWKDLGGRTALIDGITNAFDALGSVLTPIKNAFVEIFPPATAQQLYNLTVTFRDFMARLKIGDDTANNLRRTFAGLFAILGIGWDIVKAGAKFIDDMVSKLTKGSGGFLKFTANIGDFLVALKNSIEAGNVFNRIFGDLEKVLQIPLNLIRALGAAFVALFESAKKGPEQVKNAVENMTGAVAPLQKTAQTLSDFWHHIEDILDTIAGKLQTLGGEFVQWAKGVGQAISGVFKGGLDFGAITGALGTGFLGVLVLSLRKFINNISSYLKEGGGLFSNISEAVEGLTKTLSSMQKTLNAAALLGIALAVGVLTLAMIGLSKIDAGGLTRGGSAIAALMIELAGAFAVLNKIAGTGSAFKIGVISAGLILLAVAIDILASAVAKLGALPFNQLIKGLTGVIVLLGALAGTTQLMDTATPGMIRTGAGLILLAAAIRILVSSVEALGGMDWESLAKGLTGVAVLLGALALFTRLADADKGGVFQGAGIILLATGIRILAAAVGDFTKFNWEELARGMAGVAVGLGIITAAMNLLPTSTVFKAAGVTIIAAALKLIADGVARMSELRWDQMARGLTTMAVSLGLIVAALALIPSGAVFSAAAVVIVAASLEILANVLSKFAHFSWEEIAKGLVTLAGSLIIIAAALIVMDGTLAGSAALLVAAAALAILTPVIVTLGGLDLWSIIKAFIALAGAFIIIGLAGLVLTPLVPSLLGLGAAVLLLGAGAALAGLGVLAFATGLSILATVAAASTAVLVGLIVSLVALIPYIATQIGLGLVAFALVIANSGPAMLQAMTAVMLALLQAIVTVVPQLVDTIVTLVNKLLDVLANNIPNFIQKGADIIVGILAGIAQNLGRVIDAATNIVIAFLDGIGRNYPRMVDAGFKMIINVINGIANAVRANSGAMGDAGANLASALVSGAVNGLNAFGGRIGAKLLSLAQDAWNAVTKFFDVNSPSKRMIGLSQSIVEGAVVGLDKYGHQMADAAVVMSQNTVDGMTKTLSGLSDAIGASDLVDFNPTIAPVLDLSQVKKDAASLTDILALPELTVGVTASSAQNANNSFESNRTPTDATNATPPAAPTYNYTQNNTSPKALSTTEIYRQTKNLVSQTKEGS